MQQYRIGDTVLYGVHGICKIEEQTQRKFGGKRQEYYILKPVYTPDSTIFVPVGNETLVSKMRRILSAGEIRALIQAMPDEHSAWIEDETIRKEQYREILARGDRVELVRLIKALYLHQKEQQQRGRRLHMTDERFMKDAEKMLYEEFAYVLKIRREQVLPFILDQVQVAEKTTIA
ncbi:MAG: CarD family transcriptional regulator [Oscillospiraceae bacterium]|nr:CarD family transcriptional regulator [Oscillospiraceae bacterium]